jgi:hypothetical protein
MKKIILVALMVLVILTIELQVNSVSAIPSMSQNIPPIVSVGEMQVNAYISSIGEEPWAKVDIEYKMDTIHAFGESYFDSNYGQTSNVVTNKLEAHYPIPLSAKNISIKVNNEEEEWQLDNKGFCHIFDSNLPEINWTIQPVPNHFTITVHYEEPIPVTTESTSYLGQYALVFPLILRFGSTDTPSYPLYTWFDYGTTDAMFAIQTQAYISQINAYSIATNGTLPKIAYPTGNSAELLQFKISGSGDQILFQRYSRNANLVSNDPTLFPKGAVVTMNSETAQSTFPNLAVLVVAGVISAVICVSVGLLLFRRRRKTAKA